jgi:hypothetical protein
VWTNQTSSVNLGNSPTAYLSASGWKAASKRRIALYDYDFFYSRSSTIPFTEWNGLGKPAFTPSGGREYQIYKHSGNVNMAFDVAANERMMFLIDGDVVVNGDINVEVGGALVVISSGKISFEPWVANAEGVFIGDSLEVMANNESDPVFRGEGTFVGWYSITLSRNRGTLNNSQPSEEFVFRPDFLVNAPDALKRSIYSWREVAP